MTPEQNNNTWTGMDGNTYTPGAFGPTIVPNSGNQSGQAAGQQARNTVMTDANIRETTIPSLNSRARTLYAPVPNRYGGAGSVAFNPNDPRGSTTGFLRPESGTQNDSFGGMGSFEDTYRSIYGDDGGEDPVMKSQLALLESLRAKSDAQTAASLNAIQGEFNTRRNQLKESQASQTKGVETALNLGGSARYTPISSSGILSAKERYDMQAINELSTAEESVKQNILNAQADRDFRIMEQQFNLLDKVRAEKKARTDKLKDDMYAETKAQREKQIARSREMAIVDLHKQGITDPVEMYDYLNFDESGNAIGDISIDEIQAVTTKLDKTKGFQGDLKEYSDAKNAGIIPADMTLGEYRKQKAADTHYETPLDIELKKAQLAEAKAKSIVAENAPQLNDFEKKKAEQDILDYQTSQTAYESIKSVLAKYGVTDPSKVTDKDIKDMSDSDAATMGKALARIQAPDVARAGGDPGDALSPDSFFGKAYNILIDKGIYGKQYPTEKVVEAIKTADTIHIGRQKTVAPLMTKNYESIRATLKPGEILIKRNGQLGKIPEGEFNSATDIKI